MNRVIDHIISIKSPFAQAGICAIVVGIADALAVIADLYWLAGDLGHSPQPYHYVVLGGLILALILIVASFYWLGRSLLIWEERIHNLEVSSIKSSRDYTPSHCDVSKELKYLRNKPYKYIETSD